MKKYNTPEIALIAFEAMDVIMASDGNETAKDYVSLENLVITDIETL